MKRALVAAATVMMAGTSIWLAAAPADAKMTPPMIHVTNYSATIKVVPRWTYGDGGKLAVITTCSPRPVMSVVMSTMLPHAVDLRGGGNLLIKVTGKTKPGKYTIMLWCVGGNSFTYALAVTSVKIMTLLPPFNQPTAPALPRNFKATATVSSAPPVVKKATKAKKKS
jgi:hypothetical protein